MLIGCFFTLGVFLFILQTTVFQLFPPWLGRMDPLFVLLVFIAFHLKIFPGAFLILLFGLIMDIFLGVFSGLYPIIFLTLFCFIQWLSRLIIINEPPQQIFLVLISFMFTNFINFIFINLLVPENPPKWIWETILVQLFMLAVITVPLFKMYELMLAKLRHKKSSRVFSGKKKINRFKD